MTEEEEEEEEGDVRVDRILRDEALLAEEQLTRTKGERMEEADGDMKVQEGCSWKIKRILTV